ncbi:hypothetical protein LINPERHAP1_LOCUS39527 [Linum perenne]
MSLPGAIQFPILLGPANPEGASEDRFFKGTLLGASIIIPFPFSSNVNFLLVDK